MIQKCTISNFAKNCSNLAVGQNINVIYPENSEVCQIVDCARVYNEIIFKIATFGAATLCTLMIIVVFGMR